MKIGITVSIDVTKIDKARLFVGKKGKYMDLTTFIDLDNLDQYDNNGFISQSTSKEEREQGVQTEILGNVKLFYRDDKQSQPSNFSEVPEQSRQVDDLEDDLPFN